MTEGLSLSFQGEAQCPLAQNGGEAWVTPLGHFGKLSPLHSVVEEILRGALIFMTSRSLGIQIMNFLCLSRYHVQGKVSLGPSQACKKIPVWRRVTSAPTLSFPSLVSRTFSTPSHQNPSC